MNIKTAKFLFLFIFLICGYLSNSQSNKNNILVYGKIQILNTEEMPLKARPNLKMNLAIDSIKDLIPSYLIKIFPIQSSPTPNNSLSSNPCFSVSPNIAIDSTYSDSKGNYSFQLPPGNYSIFIEINGCYVIQDFSYFPETQKNYVNLISVVQQPVQRNLNLKAIF